MDYNHGPPGVLKNALGWVGPPWKDKPVGLVSYGGISGGMRAVERPSELTKENLKKMLGEIVRLKTAFAKS